jgi:hypothetical protein
MSELFESDLSLNEEEYLFEVLGGYPVAIDTAYPERANATSMRDYSKQQDIFEFFENLDPELRKNYHHISRIALEPPDQDSLTLGLYGFDPMNHAEYLITGLQISDPDRRYPNVKQIVISELEMLKSWINVQSSSDVRPILGFENNSGIMDSYRVAWFSYPNSLNYGFNSGSSSVDRMEKYLKDLYKFIEDPSSESWAAGSIRSRAARKLVQMSQENDIISL